MQETITLSEEERQIVSRVAEDRNISFEEAGQVIFNEGLQKLLGEISPTTMALKGILRASKGQNKN